MKRRLISLFFLAALSCSASSTIVYLGSLGLYGPVDLLVDQVKVIVAACINRDLPIAATWEANLLTLNDFPVSDQKTYLEAAWLNQQFAVNSDWQGIHQGIWNLFGSFRPEGVPWDALAEANYLTIDPKTVRLLVATPAYFVQTFIVLPDTEVPEPATYAAMLIGLVFGCALRVRNRNSLRVRCQDR
jgi:hypothetical protein